MPTTEANRARLPLTWSAAALLLLLGAVPCTGQPVPIQVANPSTMARPDEVVRVAWADLQQHTEALADGEVRVIDDATGRDVLSQLIDEDGDGAVDALLFLVSLWPEEAKTYRVEPGRAGDAMAARVAVRHDAYRDDVAWESDRVAFRTYGQGLWNAAEYDPLVSSGIDVWPKRVQDLVVERWYAKGHDAYHIDTGEGADFYSVGPTLGGGGTAVWRDGQLHRARNFADHRILAAGPIRVVFELVYEPWQAGDLRVAETKRITMDAGQFVFRSESTFETPTADSLTYAVGFVKREEGLVGSMRQATPEWAWLSAWGPVERKNGGHGSLGTAAIVPRARLVDVRETDDHYLALLTATPNEPVLQYVGAGWTASGAFETVEDWWAYLDAFAQRQAAPLAVTLQP